MPWAHPGIPWASGGVYPWGSSPPFGEKPAGTSPAARQTWKSFLDGPSGCQSFPITSPPVGVTADHQVVPDMLLLEAHFPSASFADRWRTFSWDGVSNAT